MSGPGADVVMCEAEQMARGTGMACDRGHGGEEGLKSRPAFCNQKDCADIPQEPAAWLSAAGLVELLSMRSSAADQYFCKRIAQGPSMERWLRLRQQKGSIVKGQCTCG
eukprot:2885988-Pleurochrysis_carterae.AAC.4